jgi:hypothetical protein
LLSGRSNEEVENTTSPSRSPPRQCACGCGKFTKGGEFCPGHDAKLRGKFLARIDDGDEKAIDEFLNDWPKLSVNYGYTREKLHIRLGGGTLKQKRHLTPTR